MDCADPPSCLRKGLEALGLPLSEAAQKKLLDYLDLLERWNRVHHLTAIRNKRDMVIRHLLDSLSIAPYVEGERVLDVGTGPGLPGIPLAVALPEKRFVLLDSASKKVRFLRHGVVMLGLSNVRVVQARVEDYHPQEPFDTLVARAFSDIPTLLARVRHLMHPGSVLLAMKGRHPAEEIGALPQDFRLLGVEPLKVPGLEGERHLVRIALSPCEVCL
ncbi:MAG: 16S rRNA (guanine(527)-N(7))-methyltransferase RsmG [Gammaproteobacteria bacterium]|nr:MAG: 16S rRNA (guanine(527)-N(7))-methyltransferase RsmG [Gammaproteobacteria bacterium]